MEQRDSLAEGKGMMEKKLIYSKEELNKILMKEKCVLYGAGRVGRTVLKYAINQQKPIEKILVSDIRNNPCNMYGATVLKVDEYKDKLEDTCLIVCTREQVHHELLDTVFGLKTKDLFFISDKVCAELEIGMENPVFVQRPHMQYLILNILDHCNLRCKGCDHFACLADEYVVALESLQKDIERMAELFGIEGIREIAVMGGEPLLHPQLPEILEIVRKNFPKTAIRLTTNGLFLLKQNERFWRVCKENSVTIVVTRYPINLKFEEIKEKSKQEGVSFIYYQGTDDDVEKNFSKRVIDLNGSSEPQEMFAKCNVANYGNFLMEGKIYGCPFAAQSYRIFNPKFNANLQMTEEDYLDIYQVEDMKEIMEFAARPKPYCRYCGGLKSGVTWGISKKEMSEWVDEE